MDEEEDIIPVDQLAIDAAAIVSETDAAHSSGDDEEGWLSRRHYQHNRQCAGAAEATTDENETSQGQGEEDDSDDDADMKSAAGPADYYSENMDDDDEAWVYKHMRGGGEELVQRQKQRQQQKSDAKTNNREQTDADENGERVSKSARRSSEPMGDQDVTNRKPMSESKGKDDGEKSTPQNPQLQQALLHKPRTSDAILSCPRCFNIVCMDCQQHDRYANQYRAMFVMNIGVDWNKRMAYDDTVGALKLESSGAEGREENAALMQVDNAEDAAAAPYKIPHETAEHHTPRNQEKKELYYSVHCSYCQLEVAALDMEDEIYYFFGCIASA